MKTICSISLAACFVLASSASYAGMNGPNSPTGGVSSQIGGGTTFGAAQLGASFNSDGSIITGIGAKANAVVVTTGAYQVNFNRPIVGCVWTGSIGFGSFTGQTGPSFISVTGRGGTTKSLFVQTWNQSGAPTNVPFEVHVICG